MSRLFLERMNEMNTIYKTSGGARRAYVVLLLALATVLAACSYAAAGQAITVTNPNDLTAEVGYDEAGGGTYNTWAAGTPGQNGVITITGNQTYNSTGASGNPIWFIHGATPANPVPNSGRGFTNLTINGNNMSISATGTTAADQRALLHIMNVTGDLSINNLTVTGGLLNSNTLVNGGAGMYLGATARYYDSVNNYTYGASFTNLNMNSVVISNNRINITDTTGPATAGAGVVVNGTDYVAGATSSTSVFSNVEIRNNSNTLDSTAADRNWGNVIGGGARILNVNDFTYAGGKVIGNEAVSVAGATAFGGGMQIDSDYATTTKLQGVEFTNNSAIVNQTVNSLSGIPGASPSESYARGGALSVQFDPWGTGLASSHDDVMTVAIDSGTVFTGNTAEAIGYSANAMGGAVHLDDNVNATFDGVNGAVMFNGNQAIANDAQNLIGGLGADGGNAQGGAVSSIVRYSTTPRNNTDYQGAMTFKNLGFSGNQALARSNAEGGSIYTETKLATDNVVFKNSLAQATTGWARGGAISSVYTDRGLGANSILGSTFTNNTAEALISGDNAYGGAVYQSQGILDVTDSSFIDNKAIANNMLASAGGGAIFMDTSVAATSSTLNLKSTAASKEVIIRGNTSEVSGTKKYDGIYFGNSGTNSLANAAFNIDTTTTGIVSLLDPVTVNMNNGMDFAMTKTGTGRLNWDGENVFSTLNGDSKIDLLDGDVYFDENFTAASRGTSLNQVNNFDVNVADAAKLSFSATREDASILGNKAIFDFNDGNTANKSLTIGTGANTVKLDTSLDRELLSFSRTYVLADGLAAGDATTAAAGFDWSGSSLITDVRASGTQVLVDVGYANNWDQAYNSNNAQYAAQELLKQKNSDGTYRLSDAQAAAIRNNPRASTAELYMDGAKIFLNTATRFAENAVMIGLRQPFRTNEAQPAYGRRVASRRGANDAYESRAYGPDSGFRLWAGYFGDWRDMDSHSGFNGYKADTDGFVIGMNYDFSRQASIGIYGGYTSTDTRAHLISSNTDSDNYHFGVAGRVAPLVSLPNLCFFGDIAYVGSDNDTYRNVGGWHTTGSYDQDFWSIGIGAENTFRFGDFSLIPSATLRWAYIDQDGLNEGGLSGTHVDDFDKHAFYSRLGFDAGYDFKLQNAIITPKVGLGWRHDFSSRTFASNSFYMGVPNPITFRTTSARADRDSLDINLGISTVVDLSGKTKLGVDFGYQYNVSRHTDDHTIYAGVSLGF